MSSRSRYSVENKGYFEEYRRILFYILQDDSIYIHIRTPLCILFKQYFSERPRNSAAEPWSQARMENQTCSKCHSCICLKRQTILYVLIIMLEKIEYGHFQKSS